MRAARRSRCYGAGLPDPASPRPLCARPVRCERAADLSSPLCTSGTCVTLVEGEKGYGLAVTTYGTDPALLPDKQVEFGAEMTVVFASELEIDGDPMGGDASGSVSLLGAADTKGKQATRPRRRCRGPR